MSLAYGRATLLRGGGDFYSVKFRPVIILFSHTYYFTFRTFGFFSLVSFWRNLISSSKFSTSKNFYIVVTHKILREVVVSTNENAAVRSRNFSAVGMILNFLRALGDSVSVGF